MIPEDTPLGTEVWTTLCEDGWASILPAVVENFHGTRVARYNSACTKTLSRPDVFLEKKDALLAALNYLEGEHKNLETLIKNLELELGECEASK